jgi:NACHT domain
VDAAIVSVLLGVISNGLFALLTVPVSRDSARRKAVVRAVEQALAAASDPTGMDQPSDGDTVHEFLRSPEVAALLRQIFATQALGRADALPVGRALFARLYQAYVRPLAHDPRAPDELFDVLVTGAAAALAAAGAKRFLPGHAALEALRHGLIMDAIGGIQRMLELADEHGMPSMRDIDVFAEMYRRQSSSRLGTISPPAFDATRTIPIDELYVAPCIQMGPADAGRTVRGLAEIVGRLHRTVILGSPGAGKSTFARKLCHDVALDRLSGELVPAGTVPILVVLREYGVGKLDRALSVRDFVEQRAHVDLQLDVPKTAMEYLLRSGRALVVFDGLDELLDTGYRQEITADIESFASLYPLVPILVTSRQVGYPEAPLDPNRFAVATLGAFDDPQVAEYAQKWFRLTPDTTASRGDAEVVGFLTDSKEVTDLRSNPLLLALMCNLYRGAGYIPRNRPAIYEKCAVMLFERWDRGRRIQVELGFERHLRPTLQHLAYWIYTQSRLQPGVPERLLVEEAAAYLRRKRFPDEDEARGEATKFVEFCRGRAWVFTDAGTTPRGERLYDFTHRTFLEFFSAEHLVRTCRTPAELAATLVPYLRRAEWDTVAQLAFQLQDNSLEGAADELLAEVLRASRSPSADGRFALLEFAARSLAFLVPEPPTLARVSGHIASLTLLLYQEKVDPNPCSGAFHALAAVNSENRPGVARAIRLVVRDGPAEGATPDVLAKLRSHALLADVGVA